MLTKTIAFSVSPKYYETISIYAERLEVSVGTWCHMYITNMLLLEGVVEPDELDME